MYRSLFRIRRSAPVGRPSLRSVSGTALPAVAAFLIASLVMIGGFADRATAQPGNIFGKNKVQYKDFDWKFIQSPHFDVYFYQGGRELAEFTADHAEKALESIQKTVKYDITNRVSILIYNSHNDFQ